MQAYSHQYCWHSICVQLLSCCHVWCGGAHLSTTLQSHKSWRATWHRCWDRRHAPNRRCTATTALQLATLAGIAAHAVPHSCVLFSVRGDAPGERAAKSAGNGAGWKGNMHVLSVWPGHAVLPEPTTRNSAASVSHTPAQHVQTVQQPVADCNPTHPHQP